MPLMSVPYCACGIGSFIKVGIVSDGDDMGINIHIWDFLQKSLSYLGKDLSGIKMCELGNQQIRVPSRMGVTTRIAKDYFQSLGIDHTSVDINGNNGTLYYDLNKPITDPKILNQFDIVTNFGTSEHVDDQFQCFCNIHNFCKKGGIFVHCVPMKGSWPNVRRFVHSCQYRYPMHFFTRLSKIYGYDMLHSKIIVQKKHKLNVRENQSTVSVIMSKATDCLFDKSLFNLCDIDVKRTKIFGIGLPRTGTSSLAKSLRMLGFNVKHSAGRFQMYRYMTNPSKRHLPRYTLDFLDDGKEGGFQGLTDTPANLLYKDLHEVYPDAKFILTIRRDNKAWHKSCKYHYGRNSHINRGDTLRYLRMQLFGSLEYDYDCFQKTYAKHDQGVLDYFRDRDKDNLLVMDVTAGDHWNKLCPFLNVDIPDVAFPWKHQRG